MQKLKDEITKLRDTNSTLEVILFKNIIHSKLRNQLLIKQASQNKETLQHDIIDEKIDLFTAEELRQRYNILFQQISFIS